MLYLLTLLLAAALGWLLWQERKTEQEWLEELKELRAKSNPIDYKIITSDASKQPEAPAALPEPAELAFTLIEDEPAQPEPEAAAQETPVPAHPEPAAEAATAEPAATPVYREPIAPDPVPFPRGISKFFRAPEAEPARAESEITLEEATRNLRLAMAAHHAEQPQVSIDRSTESPAPTQGQPENRVPEAEEAITPAPAAPELPPFPEETAEPLPEPSADAEVISSEEATRLLHGRRLEETAAPVSPPDIVIVAEEAEAAHAKPEAQSLQALRAEVAALLESVFPPIPEAETRAHSDERPETIDIADIQDSLAKQRAARLLKQQAEQPNIPTYPQPDVSGSLKTIPAQEVWANLNHTRVPAARKQAEAAPTPRFAAANRFQAAPPAKPVDGVAVTGAPAAFAQSPIPAPEIAEPASFQSAKQHTGSFPRPEAAPAEETEPQKQPENTAAPSPADFAEYYAKQQMPIDFSTEESDYGEFRLPPLTLLAPAQYNPAAVQSPEQLLENSITIEEKLAEYKVKVKVLDSCAGPVITRYEIEPDIGVRGSSVLNLERDLARSLGVTAIRVVETIPGKTCMGLELPNPKRQIIRLREVFDSPAFQDSRSQLTIALGQDITGEPVVTDLAKAPHLLVAGTTGSGKSVGVNAMVLSMLYKATPDDVRMIMIDPKMLELSVYEGIPHLLAPVVTDMKLAANALNWCVNEMEKRYRLMSHVGVRNLAGYNDKIKDAALRGQKIANPFSYTPDDPEPLEKLPFIVVVVDEFADLMMTAGKQIEQLIARLAQKARAAGIHLILATQRPSVDVITGLIKANIPTRIAFQVSTKIDSRTILDQMGAENLLGQGDMLFLPPGTGYPQRVHGAFVGDDEVHRVVEYLKRFGEPDYIDDILTPEQAELGLEGGATGNGSERDALFDQAVEIVLRTKKTSLSSLQRHLRVGYNKAATIMDQMEADGIVSAADHTGKRKILARPSEH